jgi:hypothetical protein
MEGVITRVVKTCDRGRSWTPLVHAVRMFEPYNVQSEEPLIRTLCGFWSDLTQITYMPDLKLTTCLFCLAQGGA